MTDGVHTAAADGQVGPPTRSRGRGVEPVRAYAAMNTVRALELLTFRALSTRPAAARPPGAARRAELAEGLQDLAEAAAATLAALGDSPGEPSTDDA